MNWRATSVPLLLCVTIVAVAGTRPTVAQGADAKIKITKLSDLPPHTYAVSGKPSVIVENAKTMLDLAARVDADITSDLEKYDIQDRTTLQRYAGNQLTIAMLRKEWDKALALAERLRGLEEKPADKLTTGLLIHAIVAGCARRG